MNKVVRELFKFIEESPSQFHAVENEKKRFIDAGFEELSEAKEWQLERAILSQEMARPSLHLECLKRV